jgi:hypothetical protein
MALADASNRRIAGHLPDVLGPECEQSNPRTAARRGSRSFATGVAGTDHQDVVHACRLSGTAFHVKLFAETEAAEQRVQDVFDTSATRQPIERRPRDAQILRKQHGLSHIRR